MKGMSPQSIKNYLEENDSEETPRRESGDELNDTKERFQCMTLYKRETPRRGEEVSWEQYALWRQEQKSRATRLQKQLKARWELEDLIEEQLNRFHAHYNRAMVPTRLKDVSQLLMPKWAHPHELASLYWLGDWRPSAILDLLRGLTRSSSSSSSLSSLSLSNLTGTGNEHLLSKLIHEIHIEETIIDEEMAEIQATCIMHLPFAPVKNGSTGSALGCVQSEFKKIERVITKAQQLRFKALELVVKKVLSQTNAAEFLVAFAAIQDAIHLFAERQKLLKGPVMVPVKALGST